MAIPKANNKQNQKDMLKNKELKPATKSVAKIVMYKAELIANVYERLKFTSPMYDYNSNLYPTPLMVLNKSSPIFSLNFLI